MDPENKGKITLYRTKDWKASVEVCLEGETVWLTQSQMGKLFDRERSVITKHIHWEGKGGQAWLVAFFKMFPKHR